MTVNPYVTEVTYGSRTDREFHLEAFGRALAKALNMPPIIDSPGTKYPSVSIDAGDGLRLVLRAEYGAKVGKVEVYASTNEDITLEHHERSKFPSAGVDSTRAITEIAKDLTRRVIAPARPLMLETRAAVTNRAKTVGGLKELSRKLMADFPGLSITHRNNEKSADVYYNANGAYLYGSIDATGRLNIQRFSVSSTEQTRAVFALIAGIKE